MTFIISDMSTGKSKQLEQIICKKVKPAEEEKKTKGKGKKLLAPVEAQ
jgi:hypothetical protein